MEKVKKVSNCFNWKFYSSFRKHRRSGGITLYSCSLLPTLNEAGLMEKHRSGSTTWELLEAFLKTTFANFMTLISFCTPENFRKLEIKCINWVNPLSTNPTKWSNTVKQFVGKLSTNCLSVFDHFVKLAFKGLSALDLTLRKIP